MNKGIAFLCPVPLLLSLLSHTLATAATVWNGPTMAFTKPDFGDPTLPANQDRITGTAWITRGNSQGPFNAKTESFYSDSTSPADTEWAYGDLADYASLSYTNWSVWNGHHAVDMIGQPAVLHLISEDIYLSFMFTSWSSHSAGGFSVTRSTPSATPPPPPAPRLTGSVFSGGSGFTFSFTNSPGYTFSILGTTNVALPISDWTLIGMITDAPAGSGLYSFTDNTSPGQPNLCYRVRWP